MSFVYAMTYLIGLNKFGPIGDQILFIVLVRTLVDKEKPTYTKGIEKYIVYHLSSYYVPS